MTHPRGTAAYPAPVCPAEIWVPLPSVNQVYCGGGALVTGRGKVVEGTAAVCW